MNEVVWRPVYKYFVVYAEKYDTKVFWMTSERFKLVNYRAKKSKRLALHIMPTRNRLGSRLKETHLQRLKK